MATATSSLSIARTWRQIVWFVKRCDSRSPPHMIRIYHDHELVAIHPRLFKHGEVSTVTDHLPPDAQAYLVRDPQWCLTQAKGIGSACLAVV